MQIGTRVAAGPLTCIAVQLVGRRQHALIQYREHRLAARLVWLFVSFVPYVMWQLYMSMILVSAIIDSCLSSY